MIDAPVIYDPASDANKTANGRAIGINVMVEYHNNSRIILNSKPFFL